MADLAKLDLKQHLRCALQIFSEQRMGGRWPAEIGIVGDLIVLRCKEALSPSEINLGTMKAGRLLLQEVSERLCRELQPDLDKLLGEITGLCLVDICAGFFQERSERISLFTMNDPVRQRNK